MNSIMKSAINPRGPLLSEALRHGITLRQSHHQEWRFVHVHGRGLTSDAWGAACEAVQPAVAKFNWHGDKYTLQRSMDAFNAVQHSYFEAYWQMPAVCPGSQQRFIEAGGRIINRRGEVKTEGERVVNLGGVTSECDKVKHVAGMVDHLYYAHGWSRERVLEVVEWYENRRAAGVLTAAPVQNFEHLQIN